jgi:serine/threonine protein kinase
VKILDRNPPPLAERCVVPEAFDRVVRKCLAKDPDERWQSAHDLLDELKWIAAMPRDGRRSAASAPKPVHAASPSLPQARSRSPPSEPPRLLRLAAKQPPVVKLALLPPGRAQFGELRGVARRNASGLRRREQRQRHSCGHGPSMP